MPPARKKAKVGYQRQAWEGGGGVEQGANKAVQYSSLPQLPMEGSKRTGTDPVDFKH